MDITLKKPFFISDLHLEDVNSLNAQAFFKLCQRLKNNYSEFVILGDLFEGWPGDDFSDSGIGLAVVNQLKELVQHNIRVFVMQGNRDFLLGATFCQLSGAVLLEDPTVVLLNDQRIILSHGDRYCINDVAYQKWRATCRLPEWQEGFLKLPKEQRLLLAQQARQQSEMTKSTYDAAVMDVVDDAILKDFEAFDANLMIHGHTHRPGHYPVGDKAFRWVLSDWALDDEEHPRASGLASIDQKLCVVDC